MDHHPFSLGCLRFNVTITLPHGNHVRQYTVLMNIPYYYLFLCIAFYIVILLMISPCLNKLCMFCPGLEFAYSESPRYVHGVVIGVYLAMIGAGFFLASALVAVVSKLSHSQWYPVDINHGSLEKYFSLLVGLMLANFLVFLAVSVRYGYTSFPSRTIQSDRPGNTQLERRRRHRTLSWR